MRTTVQDKQAKQALKRIDAFPPLPPKNADYLIFAIRALGVCYKRTYLPLPDLTYKYSSERSHTVQPGSAPRNMGGEGGGGRGEKLCGSVCPKIL